MGVFDLRNVHFVQRRYVILLYTRPMREFWLIGYLGKCNPGVPRELHLGLTIVGMTLVDIVTDLLGKSACLECYDKDT